MAAKVRSESLPRPRALAHCAQCRAKRLGRRAALPGRQMPGEAEGLGKSTHRGRRRPTFVRPAAPRNGESSGETRVASNAERIKYRGPHHATFGIVPEGVRTCGCTQQGRHRRIAPFNHPLRRTFEPCPKGRSSRPWGRSKGSAEPPKAPEPVQPPKSAKPPQGPPKVRRSRPSGALRGVGGAAQGAAELPKDSPRPPKWRSRRATAQRVRETAQGPPKRPPKVSRGTAFWAIIHAIWIPWRYGADLRGPAKPEPLCGSDLSSRLKRAMMRVAKTGVTRGQLAS